MMNRRCFPLVAASLMALSSQAQQFDFNIASRKAAEVTALNFTPVGVKKGNDTVKQALLDGLAKSRATPKYAALLKKYNFEAPTDADLAALMPQ